MTRIIKRFGSVIFLVFIGISVAFLLTIESVFNGGFYYAIKMLWLPIGILIFGFTWFSRSRWYAWIIAAVLYPIVLLMSWPYVMAVNALTSTEETVIYEGVVTNRWIGGGRVLSHQIVISDKETQEEVTLTVSKSDYEALTLGDSVQSVFSVGGLGIPFRWRYGK